MQKSKEIAIYQKIIKKFGKEAQMIVAIEECSELQKAITKLLRGYDYITALSEEIADVEIMIEQLKIMFKNKKQVDEFIKFRLQRMEQLLRSWNKNENQNK